MRIYTIQFSTDGGDACALQYEAHDEQDAMDRFFSATGLCETNIFRITSEECT